jgi:hypothetical protein
MTDTISMPLELIKMATEFAVVPLIVVLWRLNSSISDLKVTMHEKFLTKEEFNARQKERHRSEYD